MKVSEHEHPLELIDLQQEYPPYVEEEEEDADGDGGNPVTKEGFQCTCGRCGEKITMYHRHYYKCIGSCDYSLHKFCGELSARLVHTSHPHPLTLVDDRGRIREWRCTICNSLPTPLEIYYECSSCDFFLDIKCAMEVGKHIIHHPCHPHLLMRAMAKYIMCRCNACGKRHWGIFYQCTICATFAIHKDCAFLPKTLLIQQVTENASHHTHPLTLSYSFPQMEQNVKHHPRCRLCGDHFYEYLWLYKCEQCMYYVHMNCAKLGRNHPFPTRALPAGFEKRYVSDVDYPHILHLPLPDETHSIPKNLFFKEITSRTFRSDELNLKHMSHQHPLILVGAQCNESIKQTSSKINSLLCHNPMKKIQLLCNGCLRPITAMPFFKCADEEEHCNFALHEWCTRLPENIENHPGHSQHTLVLMSNVLKMFFGVFHCSVCRLLCNGFSYGCVECEYYVDVSCGFIPKEIIHKAHPHSLSVESKTYWNDTCHMCLLPIKWDPFSKLVPKELVFRCHSHSCFISIHPECALLLPETIRHKYDKHPMHLNYLPIENHYSEYFCEICEEDLNPHASFYHCQHCAQSIHTACATLILQSETETCIRYPQSTHCFVNIKFGGILNTRVHSHPLSFAQGILSDGTCSKCGEGLQYKMVFKCLQCKFAIDYNCCESFNKP